MRNKKGITLIALVVTIIVLLILAGVSLSLIAGENGILGRATESTNKTKIAMAKEQVALKIADYQLAYHEEKRTEPLGEWIYLSCQGQEIKTADFVFTIEEQEENYRITVQDPQITGTLSTTGVLKWTDDKQENEDFVQNSDIQIITEKSEIGKTDVAANHYEFATIGAEIKPAETITKVTINGKATMWDAQVGKISQKVTENGSYKIVAYQEENQYNEVMVQVSGLSEDLEIRNEEELRNFKQSVETGRTYKGKKVTLKENLNLTSPWTPIGYWNPMTDCQAFKGTFDGDGHMIEGLKINQQGEGWAVGFFAYLEGATVKNLKFKGVLVTSESYQTGVVGGVVVDRNDSRRNKHRIWFCYKHENQCRRNLWALGWTK